MTLEEGKMSGLDMLLSHVICKICHFHQLYYIGIRPTDKRCAGEFYNVPVTAEGEDLAANLKKLRVRKNI